MDTISLTGERSASLVDPRIRSKRQIRKMVGLAGRIVAVTDSAIAVVHTLHKGSGIKVLSIGAGRSCCVG